MKNVACYNNSNNEHLSSPTKIMATPTIPVQYRPIPTQVSSIADIPSTPNSFLLHSTNCLGTWGFGFALALAQCYPAAETVYKDFCNSYKLQSSGGDDGDDSNKNSSWPSRDLAGKCLIIPPQDEDIARGTAPRLSIVCLFTSYGYGRARAKGNKPGRDSGAVILAQTRASLGDFRGQLGGLVGAGSVEEKGLVVWSPMINSGAFGVAWEDTEALIVEAFEGWGGTWKLLQPPR